MVRSLDHIVSDAEFEKHHRSQMGHRSQKDTFFVWLVLILIAVIGAHLFLNFSGGSPTGYVTAAESPSENITLLLYSMFVVFIVVMIVALIYTGVTKFDH